MLRKERSRKAYMYDVVGIDMPCFDFAINLSTLPKPNSSQHFQELSFQGGNKVSTGMVAAARLGAKCAMAGAVGGDVFGRFCLEDFERHGIACQVKVRKGETTALSFVLSDQETQGRSILYHPGTCSRLTVPELPMALLRETGYFYLAWMDDTVLQAASVVKEAGGKVFVDADRPLPELMEHIACYDIFVASEFVYHAMFENGEYEANCRRVLEMGPEAVVFTFGARGCCGVSRREGFFWINGHRVAVTDTAGAGDVFHGALLAGLVRGMKLEEAARFANAVAAIKCTRIGGRAGIPDYETTIHFLETREIDYREIDERVKYYANCPG